MAIHVSNPGSIGSDVENLFSVTTGKGQGLITDLETTITNLGNHWKGTDATANLEDLKKVYEYVRAYVSGVQQLICELSENEVIPLLKHIELSGGSRYGFPSCVKTVTPGTISIPAASTESWTDAQIVNDATFFDGFPKKMEEFVMALESAKDTLMANWKEGAGRENVLRAFKSYSDDYTTHKTTVGKVRDNLNIVSQNKQKLM